MKAEEDEVVDGVRWEIRLHGRGGQGTVTASLLLAEAAFVHGYYAQSIPFFGAERRGAPVLAFTRISKREILERSQIYSPDCVIVLDPVLPEVVNIFSGVRSGGAVVVNTAKSPSSFTFPQERLTVGTVDAVEIAIQNDLVISGTPVVNAAMLGAFLKVFSRIPPEALESVIRKRFGDGWKANVRAMWDGYESVRVQEVRGSGRGEEAGRKEVKVRFPVSRPKRGVAGKTWVWRDFVPEIDYSKCTACLSCWLYCPESAIIRNGDGVAIDYEYCKGCLVCHSVCPRAAVRVSREVIA
ncbi:pyruvate ferredoxin oxidoreductase, gamma subunit/pyruvate ferredoxin oxidoreductase, delta subunit [Geoglobus ahangari]|uniref:pyruvate synthase n=1 Tax=Geoglobus ahangari TaxID=113653 RepID=A0A0F7IHD3_9EURY|nr:2-oxoacid:acceptor oxidoreductase family protein [Geoglobus ahangari]AKG92087.1 pyruvate ferredoxin oxidoreductase, gamma subunit/pyruvate ferredoxin oxidoreductase, delta subunit [Geoglobus ahangari]